MKGTQKLQEVVKRDLEKTYRKSLELYLAGGSEADLQTAYEIGRSAIAEGLVVLDMGAIHHAALRKVFEGGRTSASLDRDLDRAKEFFDESLSPYEMAHRGFLDSISALQRLNETLENEIKRIAHAVHDEAGKLVVAETLPRAAAHNSGRLGFGPRAAIPCGRYFQEDQIDDPRGELIGRPPCGGGCRDSLVSCRSGGAHQCHQAFLREECGHSAHPRYQNLAL